MNGFDDQARATLGDLQAAVHDLRDYVNDLDYVTTAATVAGGFPTLLGRLGNVADNLAETMRRLMPHAAGGDSPQADVLEAVDALHEIAHSLSALQNEHYGPLSIVFTRIRHEDVQAVSSS